MRDLASVARMPDQPSSISGGCQCGAIRYHADMAPKYVHYCHCRMCQRALGNVFATLVPVRKDHLTWDGAPSFYASSSLAHRGFCGACGTPLSFAYDASEWICVTLGSLDEPAAVQPEIHYGVESQVSWLHIDDELPREATDASKLAGMVDHQRRPNSPGRSGEE
jgi:hypothetical protein